MAGVAVQLAWLVGGWCVAGVAGSGLCGMVGGSCGWWGPVWLAGCMWLFCDILLRTGSIGSVCGQGISDKISSVCGTLRFAI